MPPARTAAHDHAQIIAIAGLIRYPDLVPHLIERGAGMVFSSPLSELADNLCDGHTSSLVFLPDATIFDISTAIETLDCVDDGRGWARSMIDRLALEAATETIAATFAWAAREVIAGETPIHRVIAQFNAVAQAVLA